MESLKMIGAGGLLILALFMVATKSVGQQRYCGELAFGAEGLSEDERINVTLRAKDGYTRWTGTGRPGSSPYLPTSDYGYHFKS